MDSAARRALDELARVDPIGTARHFGHRAGDRLAGPVPDPHHQVKAPAPETHREAVERPQDATSRPRTRPGLSTLRAALTAMQARVVAISGRLEQARTAITSRMESRTTEQAGPSQAQAHRDENSSRTANRLIAEGARQDEQDRKARQRADDRAAAADYHSKPARGSGQPKKRANVFADELAKAEAEAAVERLRQDLEKPGQHDHHTREREP